jgi:hypothetical protein
VSTGLTFCYSFRLFYFALCGDFNFVPSYSMVETSYSMMFGIIGLLITRGAVESLARPTSRCILFDGENISFDASLVIYK